MAEKHPIGQLVEELFKKKNVVARQLLKDLCEKYPQGHHGLTENGFRNSVNKGTIKLTTLAKVAMMLEVPLWDLVPESLQIGDSALRKRNEDRQLLERRLSELETDKEMLLGMIQLLKKELETEKNKSSKD